MQAVYTDVQDAAVGRKVLSERLVVIGRWSQIKNSGMEVEERSWADDVAHVLDENPWVDNSFEWLLTIMDPLPRTKWAFLLVIGAQGDTVYQRMARGGGGRNRKAGGIVRKERDPEALLVRLSAEGGWGLHEARKR